MRTTQDLLHGGITESHAEALTQLMLLGRTTLRRAANGEHLAPSSSYVAQVRREMRQGRSQEFKRLLSVARCDLKDGVPLAHVLAPFRRIIALIEEEAAHHTRSDRPVFSVLRSETKAQARLDLAELRLAESPTSVRALHETLLEMANYESAFSDLRVTCERQLAIVTTREVGR